MYSHLQTCFRNDNNNSKNLTGTVLLLDSWNTGGRYMHRWNSWQKFATLEHTVYAFILQQKEGYHGVLRYLVLYCRPVG